MKFDQLLDIVCRSSGNNPLRVCADSRQVKAGDIFVAIRGTSYDGHNFIKDAAARGAKFIVCQQGYASNGAEVVVVENSAKALSLLSQARAGNPAAKLVNLAVTGTNGKTTTGFLVRSVINTAGQKCGLVGTVLCDTGATSNEANMTTPDATAIADMQRQMVDSGVRYMMIEASSHGLSQDRLAGIDFRAAAFTNLTGDHLDYHKDMGNYLAAKSRLFESLGGNAAAILNKQSDVSRKIADKTGAKVLWYAVDDDADIRATTKSMDANRSVFRLEYSGKSEIVTTPLIGRHNMSNHLAAAGLCLSAGFDLKTVAAGLSELKVVPGRLEQVNCGQDFAVLVDYAHTDDALKNVLTTLKPLCKSKLIVVFGCGGDRDRTKRPRMAKIAEEFGDIVIVTSDNPRSERPEAIIEEITAGFRNPNSGNIKVEADRKKAIRLAIETAGKGDIVLLAGKGHETYQIIGKEKTDFSDTAVAAEMIRAKS